MAAKKTAARRKPAAAKARAVRRKPARAATKATARRTAPGKATRRPLRHKPETLRLRSVGPSLTVNDLGRSIAFYRDVLGFVEKERWEAEGVLRGMELAAGSVSFWLSQDDWKKGRDRIKGQGLRLYCGTVQDVDALAAQIKARGGRLAEEPHDRSWGGRDFSLVDPDGFALTIATE